MQKIIEIPKSIKELFENGEQSYKMVDYSKEMEMDNNQSMNWFIENVPIPYENIVDDSGTQIIVELNGKELCIDVGGLGDCFSHEFVVTECCTHELIHLGTCAGCGRVFN